MAGATLDPNSTSYSPGRRGSPPQILLDPAMHSDPDFVLFGLYTPSCSRWLARRLRGLIGQGLAQVFPR